MNEIKQKIVSQRVVTEHLSDIEILEQIESSVEDINPLSPTFYERIEALKEKAKGIKRPKLLKSEAVIRIKPPYAEHSLYLTLTYVEIDDRRYPYEVFFNSKDIKHRQWTDTLTLSWSSMFKMSIQHDFSLTPFINNLKDTESFEGGYRVKLEDGFDKPTYVKGLVSEIGHHIEKFADSCAGWNMMLGSLPTDKELAAMETMVEYEQYSNHLTAKGVGGKECQLCGAFSVVKENGCSVCKTCGDSACN